MMLNIALENSQNAIRKLKGATQKVRKYDTRGHDGSIQLNQVPAKFQ